MTRKNLLDCPRSGQPRVQAEVINTLAQILMHQGQYQLAHAEATKGLSIAQTIGNRSTEAPLYGVLGQLALVESSWSEAQTWFAQSGETFARIRFTLFNLAPSGLGYTACLYDQPDEARRHLVKALTMRWLSKRICRFCLR